MKLTTHLTPLSGGEGSSLAGVPDAATPTRPTAHPNHAELAQDSETFSESHTTPVLPHSDYLEGRQGVGKQKSDTVVTNTHFGS